MSLSSLFGVGRRWCSRTAPEEMWREEELIKPGGMFQPIIMLPRDLGSMYQCTPMVTIVQPCKEGESW